MKKELVRIVTSKLFFVWLILSFFVLLLYVNHYNSTKTNDVLSHYDIIKTSDKSELITKRDEAIYERDDGTKYIEILKNEETEEKEELDVVTGIEGTYYVEIKSDKLGEGMKVVLPEIDTSNSIESLINAMGADVGV